MADVKYVYLNSLLVRSGHSMFSGCPFAHIAIKFGIGLYKATIVTIAYYKDFPRLGLPVASCFKCDDTQKLTKKPIRIINDTNAISKEQLGKVNIRLEKPIDVERQSILVDTMCTSMEQHSDLPNNITTREASII